MFRLIFVASAHLCALVASATLRGASVAAGEALDKQASAVHLQDMREDIAKCLPLIASGGTQARPALFYFNFRFRMLPLCFWCCL